MWAEELGIPVYSISASDSFFELGGDSLSALRFCRKLVAIFNPRPIYEINHASGADRNAVEKANAEV